MTKSRYSSIFRVARLVLVLGMLGTACGSSGNSAPKGADLSSLECKKDPKAGLGDGEVCIDSGIRNQSLFSFANWGGRRYKADDFGFSEMIALYGESVICAKVGQRECDVTPKARLMRTVIDNMLQNGRCEGLSALGALYMNSRGPAPKSFDAEDIQSLTPRVDEFANVIDYWWATQFFNDVIDQSKSSRKSGVQSVLEQVVAGLQEQSGVTVGIYAEEGAHSVLPVAVTRTDANNYIAHVWDSNNPRALGRLEFDLQAKQWTYLGGRLNAGSASKKWTGGDGTIDAVALDTRKGTPLLDIADTKRGNATVTATSSSSQKLSVAVKTADGKELLASSKGATGAIPGVTVTPLRNGDVSQIIISIPTTISDYSVNLTAAGGDKDLSGTTQLTIDGGDSRAISLSLPVNADGTSATVSTSKSVNGIQKFDATSPQNAVVQTSTAGSIVNVPLEPRETIAFSNSKSSSIDSVVAITSPRGTTQSVNIPTPGGSATQDVVVARVADGTFVTVVNELEPIEINRDELAALTEYTSVEESSTASAQAVEAPAGAATVTARSTSSVLSDTSASVVSKISSETDLQAWLEYGPVENWTLFGRTDKKSVDAGVDTELKSNLTKLIPGTEYRLRTVMDVDGFLVYSDYSTFETTGISPDDAKTLVSDANIKVSSSLVAATATGGVISSKITTPIAAKAWVEYSLDSNPTLVSRTTEQNVSKGTGVNLVSLLNGLSMGQTYRYRVVVKARDAMGYSTLTQITTGTTVATERLAVGAIGAVFSIAISDITSSGAVVTATLTSPTKGRVQVEIANRNGDKTTRTKALAFAAGKNVKVISPVTNLSSGTTYQVRLLVSVGSVTQYGSYQLLETAREADDDTSAGRLTGLTLPASLLSETSASFSVSVKSEVEGTVFFEYSADNDSLILYRTRASAITSNTSNVGPIDTDVLLRAGTPYRVRAVITIAGKEYHTSFVKFTTPGTLDPLLYKASTPTLRRSTSGADVSWSVPTVDIPSVFSYRVIEGSTTLCTAKAMEFTCSATIASFGVHTMVVATFLNGNEITRSASASITFSGTPVISAFTFVSASSTGLVFTYSFNPQGETVQYGIQINNMQDVLVRPDLGGTTSTAMNGTTHQVTGLSPNTSYKARLILVSGNVTTSSDWVTVSTQ